MAAVEGVALGVGGGRGEGEGGEVGAVEVACDERGGGAAVQEAALVEDEELAGAALGLVEVVGGEEDGAALAGEVGQEGAQGGAAGGVEADLGLVQEEDAGAVDEASATARRRRMPPERALARSSARSRRPRASRRASARRRRSARGRRQAAPRKSSCSRGVRSSQSAMCCGHQPTAAPGAAMTRPWSGRRRPQRARRSVDLPAPLGPRSATTAPGSRRRETPSSARRSP
jgi:hypothetical protein